MKNWNEAPKISVNCLCGEEVFTYPYGMMSWDFSRYVNKLIKKKKICVWRYTKEVGSDDLFLCRDCLNKLFDGLKTGMSHKEYFYKIYDKIRYYFPIR